jgi:Rad3-related DNA helicase
MSKTDEMDFLREYERDPANSMPRDETMEALAEQCAIYREEITALGSECEQLRDNLRHMTESRDNQTMLLDHWKAKAAESLTKMQRADALEALALELAKAISAHLNPFVGRQEAHDSMRAAIDSPMLAEILAKPSATTQTPAEFAGVCEDVGGGL